MYRYYAYVEEGLGVVTTFLRTEMEPDGREKTYSLFIVRGQFFWSFHSSGPENTLFHSYSRILLDVETLVEICAQSPMIGRLPSVPTLKFLLEAII